MCSVSDCSPDALTCSNTSWDEDLQVWIGVVRLNSSIPEAEALRQLLYGDPDNSAKGADVIVLFLIDLQVNEETLPILRNMFQGVINNPEEYIFNEEDEGLAYPNVPALKVTVHVCALESGQSTPVEPPPPPKRNEQSPRPINSG